MENTLAKCGGNLIFNCFKNSDVLEEINLKNVFEGKWKKSMIS